AASPGSATVNVPGPALSLGSSSFTTDGGGTNATVSNFFDNEGVAYCLDQNTSCSGTQLGIATVPASGGTVTSSITIPAGISAGTHTVYAVGSLGSTPSASINITVGAATQLGFTVQPATNANIHATGTDTFSASVAVEDANGGAGRTVTPSVTVQVEDANGNVETGDSTTTVTLAIGTNAGGGTLSGTTTKTVASGVATFNNLSINKTGTGYTLNATSSPAN